MERSSSAFYALEQCVLSPVTEVFGEILQYVPLKAGRSV